MSESTDTPREGLIERVSRYLAWVAGGAILFCACLVTLDVFARNLFNENLFESYEITIYLFAITVSFSFSFALTTKTHIRIDVLYARVPSLGRALLDILATALLSALAVLFCYYAWAVTRQSFSFPGPGNLGAVSASDLAVPLVIPQSAWSLGLTWFALICVVYLLRAVVSILRGDLAGVHALIGIDQMESAPEMSESLQLAKDAAEDEAVRP